ncbi:MULTISPECIES: SUKH-3 domain-containing protein [unclassified Bacillus (in: firmicutes)]|uniref:SUKH-3 domain-containing protein n=1 Tax=unclassified Bacillus (in: firmicutes) TaxID=185979 RepID=UPI0008F0E33B|nr:MULTISPECIES: SUKH-3 domain-containing protein [unclassified Bacillus (in: firmicutes)]SFK07495.1 SUKH-3 immunity protein [Bacillus sp. 71mf]SFT01339.1 SUKH-3 immunity protein [Bacillus sp. 103mf]
MEISNKTIEELKKAGWYEGRKIDISENVKFLEERGFEVFESAKKFMEEFGELRINVEKIWSDGSKQISKHTTCMKEVIGMLDSSCFGLENFIDDKVIPIGSLYNFEIDLYISESGRMFKSIGWVGDNVLEALENVILEKETVIWDKFEGR